MQYFFNVYLFYLFAATSWTKSLPKDQENLLINCIKIKLQYVFLFSKLLSAYVYVRISIFKNFKRIRLRTYKCEQKHTARFIPFYLITIAGTTKKRELHFCLGKNKNCN